MTSHHSSTVFFTHRHQLGVSFSDKKYAAIVDGDFSSLTVHPALVHISYMWGALLWQGIHSTNYFDDERSLFRLAINALQDSSCRPLDPVENLQARYLLSVYCVARNDLERGKRFHQEAAQVISENDLHIFDSYTSSPSTFDVEQMHAVCQLLLSDFIPINPFKMDSSLSTALVSELERFIVGFRFLNRP